MTMERGQFFSPDLIVAMFIFVLCLVFFALAAASIGASADAFESKKNLDNAGHALVLSLTAGAGMPADWEDKNILDVNFFGLAHERNILDTEKATALKNFLDLNYALAKEKLGAGENEVQVQLIDRNGDVLLTGGMRAEGYVQSSSYALPVLYESRPVVFEVVLTHA